MKASRKVQIGRGLPSFQDPIKGFEKFCLLPFALFTFGAYTRCQRIKRPE
jgi:hypothetical protein